MSTSPSEIEKIQQRAKALEQANKDKDSKDYITRIIGHFYTMYEKEINGDEGLSKHRCTQKKYGYEVLKSARNEEGYKSLVLGRFYDDLDEGTDNPKKLFTWKNRYRRDKQKPGTLFDCISRISVIIIENKHGERLLFDLGSHARMSFSYNASWEKRKGMADARVHFADFLKNAGGEDTQEIAELTSNMISNPGNLSLDNKNTIYARASIHTAPDDEAISCVVLPKDLMIEGSFHLPEGSPIMPIVKELDFEKQMLAKFVFSSATKLHERTMVTNESDNTKLVDQGFFKQAPKKDDEKQTLSNRAVPARLKCPITGKLMAKPVFCSVDSYTYDMQPLIDYVKEHGVTPKGAKFEYESLCNVVYAHHTLIEAVKDYRQGKEPTFESHDNSTFCILDGRTYPQETIINHLVAQITNKPSGSDEAWITAPGPNSRKITADEISNSLLFPDKSYQQVVEPVIEKVEQAPALH